MTNLKNTGRPLVSFTTLSIMAVIVGMVVGIGIFRLPPLIAAQSTGAAQFILFWLAGGFISLMGALCYAELSSAMPDTGGEYYFLRKAYGPGTGFLLSWGRMTVIQTGSVALIAFILGDYVSVIYWLGPYSSAIYAAAAVIALTILNISGTLHSKWIQNVWAFMMVATLALLAGYSLLGGGAIEASGHRSGWLDAGSLSGGAPGMAMIFVLLTYGGWSEAAYLAGEVGNVRKHMIRALVLGILLITVLYVAVNIAYLHILGFDVLVESSTVGYDLTEKLFGPAGSSLVLFVIILSALSTANATLITGARTNYAVGRDFQVFRFMGKWHSGRNTPVQAFLFQGLIILGLIAGGAWSQKAINTMVDYTAPVFWFFITLVTLSLFLFRYRNGSQSLSWKVPMYPLPPLLFLASALYMLYSSLVFTGTGAIVGISILLAGIPVYILNRHKK